MLFSIAECATDLDVRHQSKGMCASGAPMTELPPRLATAALSSASTGMSKYDPLRDHLKRQTANDPVRFRRAG